MTGSSVPQLAGRELRHVLATSRVRRPRYYWTRPAIVSTELLQLEDRARGVEAIIEGPLEPEAAWVLPGWRFVSEHQDDVRLPTFTRATPISRPPPGFPGLRRVDEPTLERYRRDWRRCGPYTYQGEFRLVPASTPSGAEECTHARVACAS